MVHFAEITAENFDQAIQIKVSKEQEKIIAPVEWSLAEAYVYHDLIPFLIYDKAIPVGFILLLIDRNEAKPCFEICRLMIAEQYQRRGYGKQALAHAIAYLKLMGAKKIELSHLENNPYPVKLYQNAGFRYTGVVDDGEMMMELILEQGT